VKDILSYIDEIVLVRPEAICKTVTFPSEMRSICSALDSLISLYERGPESPRVGFTSLLSKVQRKTYLCWLWTLAAVTESVHSRSRRLVGMYLLKESKSRPIERLCTFAQFQRS
jgi:hypothetical protein